MKPQSKPSGDEHVPSAVRVISESFRVLSGSFPSRFRVVSESFRSDFEDNFRSSPPVGPLFSTGDSDISESDISDSDISDSDISDSDISDSDICPDGGKRDSDSDICTDGGKRDSDSDICTDRGKRDVPPSPGRRLGSRCRCRTKQRCIEMDE